jgi:uroporphyrinogen-III synthase
VRLLVTRPEPDAERTAASLRARGHEVILAPLLRIEAEPDADLGPGPFAGVVITSANALRSLAAHPLRAEFLKLPLYAVGTRSGDAARAEGFSSVAAADKDVRALAELILSRHAGAGAPLLYLAAEDRAGDLAGALAQAGIPVRTVTLYRAVKATALPDAAREALSAGTVGGVLHFSRRSADAYLDCARASALTRAALAPIHYCISAQTGATLLAAAAADVRIAPHPDEDALMELIGPA